MCLPSRPFDVEVDRELAVTEIPLIVMDGTLRQYRGLTPAEGEALILALADRCRRVGGPSPCCGTPTPSPILLDGTSTSAAWTI